MGISFDFLNCTKMEQQNPPLISYSNSYPIPNIFLYIGVLIFFFFSTFGDGMVVCTVQCMCCGKRESVNNNNNNKKNLSRVWDMRGRTEN